MVESVERQEDPGELADWLGLYIVWAQVVEKVSGVEEALGVLERVGSGEPQDLVPEWFISSRSREVSILCWTRRSGQQRHGQRIVCTWHIRLGTGAAIEQCWDISVWDRGNSASDASLG